ncbi:MAG: hypothetical protein U0S36_08290 [Candidatus Nanopelagicales bacterium]
MSRTRAAAVGALLLAALSTSACTPGENAVVGVSVDTQGRPVGVVAVCDGQINSASLWSLDPRADPSATPLPEASYSALPTEREQVRWTPEQPVTDVGTWSVTTGEPWTAAGSPSLDKGVSYSIAAENVTFRDGDTTGISSYARSVEFTLADLAALKPGEVRWAVGYSRAAAGQGAVVSITEFRETACRR